MHLHRPPGLDCLEEFLPYMKMLYLSRALLLSAYAQDIQRQMVSINTFFLINKQSIEQQI